MPAAESRRSSSRRRGAEVDVGGRRRPFSDRQVERIVSAVLAGERRRAQLSVTFLGRDAMRRLNARYKGRSRPTDVIAFPLHDAAGEIIGDIYICPWVAQREARTRRIPLRQELTRLLVHGTLHVLGYTHPESDEAARSASTMWRKQERYVEALT